MSTFKKQLSVFPPPLRLITEGLEIVNKRNVDAYRTFFNQTCMDEGMLKNANSHMDTPSYNSAEFIHDDRDVHRLMSIRPAWNNFLKG